MLSEGSFDTYGHLHQVFFESQVRNARDLGGIRIGDKVVRKGLLLRTGHLNDATEEDVRRLQEEFHLRRIFDFRGVPEAALQPDVEVPGAEVIQLPTLDISAEQASGDAIPDETWLNLPQHIVRLSFTRLFQKKAPSSSMPPS